MARDYSIHRQVYSMLLSKGVSPNVAAGAVGSLMGESGKHLNPNAINPNDNPRSKVHPDSIGIAQMNDTRAMALKRIAQDMGTTWNDPRAQVAAISKELDEGGSHNHVLRKLLKGSTIEDGTRIWTKDFEVPQHADRQVGVRVPHGYAIAPILAGTQAAPAPTVAQANLRSAPQPTVSGTGIPQTNVPPGLLGFDRLPIQTANFRPAPNDIERTGALPNGPLETAPAPAPEMTPPAPAPTVGLLGAPEASAPTIPAAPAVAPIEAPTLPPETTVTAVDPNMGPADLGLSTIGSGLLGFGTGGIIGTDTSGQTIDPNAGLPGMTPAPAAVAPPPTVNTPNPGATEPATTGGPQATATAAGPGGVNPKTQALQQGLKGLMSLGALGARGPLHYAPAAGGGSPLNTPGVQTPDVYRQQARIMPRIVPRGLLG